MYHDDEIVDDNHDFHGDEEREYDDHNDDEHDGLGLQR